ncbi:putative ABC transport system permease protein [Aequitasia blattaphilus]|uniref:ABC transporter permease n=1 Tax=Aequitasia blattaphilus TaxID=2949332 RepID=A0ABT1EEI5_9FIRM|nr:ABC transporter permease [Aequitasia blattaphilus]MCP1103352.1 ABC transporter permease [Aequitasia blattaphilus]MCR8615992.1 ABC transporter permease [Aequitasia blattaphilus]
MTMNKVFAKLQKSGRVNYRQIRFCITFAMILISAFISIVTNTAVKDVLPKGGDSLKQVYMIFGVALLGCFVFTAYAGGLFLRYKSKEIGLFLALGSQKKKLARALYIDLIGIIINSSGFGIIIGILLSFIILKAFQITLSTGIEKVSLLSVGGILISVLFAMIVGTFILFLAARFMKRSNIMDILNEERKSEKVNDKMSRSYVMLGTIALVVGLVIMAVIFPSIARVTNRPIGAWSNLFFLPVVWGIYRIMVYSISVHKRGRQPQRYYKNIITYGMLKFQGNSAVKNMLVVTLLIICSLFACLYTPTKYMVEQAMIRETPIDARLTFLNDMNGINQEMIETMAKRHKVQITEYQEVYWIRLIGSGVNRDDLDSNGKLKQEYEKERFYYSFISASQYNELMDRSIVVNTGEYYFLKDDNVYENSFNKFNDLDYVKNPYSNVEKDLAYQGTQEGAGLIVADGFAANSRFVISDDDYNILKTGLTGNLLETDVVFNVDESENSYEFSKELYKQFVGLAPSSMMHMSNYDEKQEMLAGGGEEYGYGELVIVNADHPEEYPDWKYIPQIKILEIKNGFISFAVFYLLFIVVTIICFAAVGIISYTRSMSMTIRNEGVFNDLRKLGANDIYLQRVLRKLLRSIYILPTMIGCLAMMIWYPLTLWQNDGRLTAGEMKIMVVEIFLCTLVALYQYTIYNISVKNAKKVVAIGERA